MRAPKRRRAPTWSKALVEATKASVKGEIDGDAGDARTPGERLERINRGIREAEDAASPAEFLRLYVYVVSALVHDARHGGLTAKDVARFRKLAYSILQVQGIQPESSTMAFLYGELHLALSQIHRRNGDHWMAAWEQQMSLTLSRREPPGGIGFQLVSQAIRTLRLGSAARALTDFTEAESDGALDSLNRERARLGRVRCLRLLGDHDAAANLAKESAAKAALRPATVLELGWEVICLDAQESGELTRMVAAVGPKGDHGQAVYLLEAIAWAYAMRGKQWIERLPKASTVARRRGVDARKLGFFLEAIEVVESCYDTDVPFAIRLDRLGAMLVRRQEVISVDRELLILAAAARWLWRAKQRELAATVLEEYRSLSLRLSNGANRDVLSLADDVLSDRDESSAA